MPRTESSMRSAFGELDVEYRELLGLLEPSLVLRRRVCKGMPTVTTEVRLQAIKRHRAILDRRRRLIATRLKVHDRVVRLLGLDHVSRPAEDAAPAPRQEVPTV